MGTKWRNHLPLKETPLQGDPAQRDPAQRNPATRGSRGNERGKSFRGEQLEN